MCFKIIKENENFVIADKSSGLLTMQARGDRKEEEHLSDILRNRYGEIYVVHRLDRDASGLILFARSQEAHRYYSGLFESREVEKTYLAAVSGVICGKYGEINKPLKQRGSGRVSVVFDGKPSLTKWRKLRDMKNSALLEVNIITGRRHQIRAHFYSEGHPLLGDRIYGNVAEQRKFPRLMLHSWDIRFTDMDGSRVHVRADPPEDFVRILDIL